MEILSTTAENEQKKYPAYPEVYPRLKINIKFQQKSKYENGKLHMLIWCGDIDSKILLCITCYFLSSRILFSSLYICLSFKNFTMKSRNCIRDSSYNIILVNIEMHVSRFRIFVNFSFTNITSLFGYLSLFSKKTSPSKK